MDDMRYEQYGAPMGYQPMEKQQGAYMNRNVPVSRYGNMPMGMMNQNRVPSQQQMNMMDQQKQGPIMNSAMGDRTMGVNDGDNGFKYNMMQNNRTGPMGMTPRSQMSVDGMDGKSQILRQNSSGPLSSQSSYGMGSTPKQAPMQAEMIENDYNSAHNLYRFFPSAFAQQTESIGNLFYALPTSFLFQTPSISPEQIKQFSTTLLLYIFYSMPNDKLQIVAAQELYSRDYVYHKVKNNWYRKGSSNYASCKCIEVFDLESCTFVNCEEDHKNRDLVSVNELQECLKKSL